MNIQALSEVLKVRSKLHDLSSHFDGAVRHVSSTRMEWAKRFKRQSNNRATVLEQLMTNLRTVPFAHLSKNTQAESIARTSQKNGKRRDRANDQIHQLVEQKKRGKKPSKPPAPKAPRSKSRPRKKSRVRSGIDFDLTKPPQQSLSPNPPKASPPPQKIQPASATTDLTSPRKPLMSGNVLPARRPSNHSRPGQSGTSHPSSIGTSSHHSSSPGQGQNSRITPPRLSLKQKKPARASIPQPSRTRPDSAREQPAPSLSPSPIWGSGSKNPNNNQLSPTAKLFAACETEEQLGGGFSQVESFLPLVAKKKKEKPKLVIPALEQAKRARERQEKQRLKKQKAKAGIRKPGPRSARQTLAGSKRRSENPNAGPPRKRVKKTKVESPHTAARNRRQRMQAEEKKRRLKAQQEKERRREANLKKANTLKKKKRPKTSQGGKMGRKSVAGKKMRMSMASLSNSLTSPKARAAFDAAQESLKTLLTRVNTDSAYLMSDIEDTGSYDMSGDDSDHPGDKQIPKWANKSFFPRLVAATRHLDPDLIFGKFENRSVDLVKIYKGLPPKKRYVKRTPSGDWTEDRLKREEDRKYKWDMGWVDS